jgi:hypothetical protein
MTRIYRNEDGDEIGRSEREPGPVRRWAGSQVRFSFWLLAGLAVLGGLAALHLWPVVIGLAVVGVLVAMCARKV